MWSRYVYGFTVDVFRTVLKPITYEQRIIRRQCAQHYKRIVFVAGDRRHLVERMLREQRLSSDVNVTQLAEDLEGYSGSDIKCVCMYV